MKHIILLIGVLFVFAGSELSCAICENAVNESPLEYHTEIITIETEETIKYAVCDSTRQILHEPIETPIEGYYSYQYAEPETGIVYQIETFVADGLDRGSCMALYIYPGGYFSDFIYSEIWRFSEGLAPVSMEYRFGYIDLTGKFVIPPQWEWAEPFKDGYATVTYRAKDKYCNAWINHDGVIVSLTDPEANK